jgi:hypothetical protein
MWVLITQAIPCHTSYALHNYQSQGILASDCITVIISIFNYLIMWNAGNVQLTKEESSQITETFFKQNIISIILSSIPDYATYLSYKCVSHIINVLSELVLTSNKFLTQVRSFHRLLTSIDV